MRQPLLVLLFGLAVTACGSPTGAADATSDAGPSGDGGSATAADAPTIVTLSQNVARLGPGEVLRVTAIVTDPQGAADLAGGRLQAGSTATYGAFTAAGGTSTFTLDLTWAEIGQVEPIDTPVGGADRTFTAEFFDNAGHKASARFPIRLACADASRALCAGVCADLATDPANCGACGVGVPPTASCSSGVPTCTGGKALCGGGCVDLTNTQGHCGSCGKTCAGDEVCKASTCMSKTPNTTCVDVSGSSFGGCSQVCASAQKVCRTSGLGVCFTNVAGIAWEGTGCTKTTTSPNYSAIQGCNDGIPSWARSVGCCCGP